MSCTWSNTGHNSGSRWPTMGVSIACKTRGCTLLGPGPSKIRFGTCTSFTKAFMAVCPPSKDGKDVKGVAWSAPGHSASTSSPRVRRAATVPGRYQFDAQQRRLEAQEDLQHGSVVYRYQKTLPIHNSRCMPHGCQDAVGPV